MLSYMYVVLTVMSQKAVIAVQEANLHHGKRTCDVVLVLIACHFSTLMSAAKGSELVLCHYLGLDSTTLLNLKK